MHNITKFYKKFPLSFHNFRKLFILILYSFMFLEKSNMCCTTFFIFDNLTTSALYKFTLLKDLLTFVL